MSAIEARLEKMGLYLPAAAKVPKDVVIDFAWARVHANAVYVSGHGPLAAATNVINGCSRLLVELFGPERGTHARTAMGVAATPLSCPVILGAQVALR